MDVYIINQELNRAKKFQIMVKRKGAFYHIFPSELFTLEEAQNICDKNGFNVVKIGDIWQCA
jgi:hypothetical protein